MERALEIGAFRNIGFYNGKIKNERIVINNSLYKDELGDLVIIIGENNSGKTNVLDAIDIYFNGFISNRDKSRIFPNENPYLKLFSRENKNEYYYKKELNRKNKFFQSKNLEEIEMNKISKKINDSYMKKYGVDFIPRVIRYDEHSFKDSDLITEINEIENHEFFKSIFNYLKMDKLDLAKCNELLNSFSDDFNRLFNYDKDYYSFKLKYDRFLEFEIYRNNNKIYLEYQSNSFNWFFNFYILIISSPKLRSGDIVLMDEPACHLHVRAQREFRAFLKNFAIKNNITFVITTNSPFLIDIDYLDEIRVIVNDGLNSSIQNSFAAINPSDPDSLLPIKDALTVENHVLLDPNNLMIFVEGITDYNYLTAMKHLLGFKNICFLPIQGVGSNIAASKIISSKLLKIKKNPILLVDNDMNGQNMKSLNVNSNLKVYSLNDACDKFLEIESLFKDEDLIKFGLATSSLKIIKHSSTSTIFKNDIMLKKKLPTKETIENFTILFNFLTNL